MIRMLALTFPQTHCLFTYLFRANRPSAEPIMYRALMKDAVCKAVYLLLSDRSGFASIPPRWAPSFLVKGVYTTSSPY